MDLTHLRHHPVGSYISIRFVLKSCFQFLICCLSIWMHTLIYVHVWFYMVMRWNCYQIFWKSDWYWLVDKRSRVYKRNGDLLDCILLTLTFHERRGQVLMEYRVLQCLALTFLWVRLLRSRIILLNSCHMTLSYSDSSWIILSDYYVASEVSHWSSILQIWRLQLSLRSWAHGTSGLALHARVSLPVSEYKWLLPCFSSHFLNLPSKS